MNRKQLELKWGKPISNFEAKCEIAHRLAEMALGAKILSVGSGTTSFLTLHAIAERLGEQRNQVAAIATSFEIEEACLSVGIRCLSMRGMRADLAFDGADEVDPEGNLIKGRGGAFFLEKLALTSAIKRIIVADASKRVDKLGTRMPLPVEVIPVAGTYVKEQINQIFPGAHTSIRMEDKSDSPTFTPRGNLILDLHGIDIDCQSEIQLLSIHGVLSTGFFPANGYVFVS